MDYPNWFAQSAQGNFEQGFPTDRPIRVLQIGAYVGHASEWILNHMAEGSHLTDVDTWEGTANEEIHGTFDWDDVETTYMERVAPWYGGPLDIFRGTSDEFFSACSTDEFDFVYIDGSHEKAQVARDAENAWIALAPGGIIAFDDYVWRAPDPANAPRPAIDEFLEAAKGEYDLLISNVQVWLRKRPEPRRAMRVAVYAIALNEEKHVARWAESAKEADHLFILDTGSADATVRLAKENGVRVITEFFDEWRFDVARNSALACLPTNIDLCVSLDLDEVLTPGWREALEDAWSRGITRPRYRYVWNWNEDGSEGTVFEADHIHHRLTHEWRHPVHETLTPRPGFTEITGRADLEIHHHADNSKSRSQYLPLLELAVAEDPTGDRNIYYLAREYLSVGRRDEAAAMFHRHLACSAWDAERSRAMIYLGGIEREHTEGWYLKAAAEAPGRREPWVALANHYYLQGAWEGALWAAKKAQAITEKPLDYLCEPWAWDSHPWDLGAIAAHHLGLRDQAVKMGQMALGCSPDDERLRGNIVFYRAG
jgi:predicted O-methyltransferase YrrM